MAKYDQTVFEASEEAFHARQEVRREFPEPVPREQKRRLARAIADYAVVLEETPDVKLESMPTTRVDVLVEKDATALMDIAKSLDKMRHDAGYHAEVNPDA